MIPVDVTSVMENRRTTLQTRKNRAPQSPASLNREASRLGDEGPRRALTREGTRAEVTLHDSVDGGYIGQSMFER